MDNEAKLQTAVSRGARAKVLLQDDILKDAFEALERDYIKGWRVTHARDTDARERLWQAVNVIGKVRDHLFQVVNDGKLAQRQIDDLAEREKRGRTPRA